MTNFVAANKILRFDSIRKRKQNKTRTTKTALSYCCQWSYSNFVQVENPIIVSTASNL